MYIIIDNTTKELLDKLNCDTFKIRDEDVVDTDDLISLIFNLNQDLEDLKEDVEQNMRRIPVAEQVDIDDYDFIDRSLLS